MEQAMNDPKLKLTRATDTQWLSHQGAVDALRRCIRSVKLVMEEEAAQGNATALGLSMHLKKPTFIATLLVLSDVLAILGSLSLSFQTNALNLLSVEDLLRDHKAALESLQEYPMCGGHTIGLKDVQASLDITELLDEDSFVPKVQSYIENIIVNLDQRFPQRHLMALFGYLDPRNVRLATPSTIMELAEHFKLDGPKCWQEFLVYRSFVKNLPIPQGQTPIEAVAHAILGPANKEAMFASFPLTSDLLARLVVLPAGSAQVERVFSSMKRIKTAQRNRLNTSTLDHLIRVSMEGPNVGEWDPFQALRIWESWGNRRLETSAPVEPTSE